MTKPPLDLRRLTAEQAARLLRSTPLGKGTTAKSIRAEVAGGVPLNPDGTLDLLSYCIWLMSESS